MAFEVRFKNESLEGLLQEGPEDKAYPPGVAKNFRKRVQYIRNAHDERDFTAMNSLGFERLKGKRQHQHAMRLNDQWRLILELEGDHPKRIVWVVAIEDYH